MAEACFVLFRSGACDIDAAERSLTGCGLTVARHGDLLAVHWGDSPTFRVRLDTGSHVPVESVEMSRGTGHEAALRECDARFDIAFDDLDAALDEINTLMQIQGALQDASQGYVCLPWNGNVWGPWSG